MIYIYILQINEYKYYYNAQDISFLNPLLSYLLYPKILKFP